MRKISVILSIIILIGLISGCGTQLIANSNTLKSKDPSPIKFINAWVTKGVLNNPEARITFQNISSKEIDGIKIMILCYDNFDDETSANNSDIYDAIYQEIIKPEEIIDGETYSWNLFPYTTTTKFTAILMDVHFKDGSIWQTYDLETKIDSRQ